MAELLIYNKDNWMDLPSKERPDLTGYENVKRKIKLNPNKLNKGQLAKALRLHDEKYAARYQVGDIVEVQEDGFWDKRGCGDKFSVVKLPGVSKEKAQYLMKSQEEGNAVLRRRKYKAVAGLAPAVKEVMSIETANIYDKETSVKVSKIG